MELHVGSSTLSRPRAFVGGRRVVASRFARHVQIPALLAVPLVTAAAGVTGKSHGELLVVYASMLLLNAAVLSPRPMLSVVAVAWISYGGFIAATGWTGSAHTVAFRVILLAAVTLESMFLSRELTRQARVHEQVRDAQERRAGLLAEVTAAARRMSKLDGDHVLSVVVDAVVGLGFEYATIGMFDEDHEEYVPTRARGLAGDDAHNVATNGPGGVPRLVLDTGKTVVLDDYAAHPNAIAALMDAGVRVAIGAPLWARGRLTGALVGARRDGRPMSSMEVEAFELLAAHAGRALENVALAEGLRSREARFRALVQGSSDLITVVDPDTTIRYQSPAERILGYAPEAMLGIKFADLLHPDDASRVRALCRDIASRPGAFVSAEFRASRGDGMWVQLEMLARNLIDDANVRGIVLSTRDVTERKALEDQLRHRAFHDPLTNLPNRALFKDRVEHALTRMHGHRDSIAVLFLDLDSFKTVNDSLGHAAGDQLLMAVAHRLGHYLRRSDTIGRLGGDEFAVLLEDVSAVRSATYVADGILNVLRAPFTIAGKEMFVNASIGIAMPMSENEGADDLLRNADVAMYQAKARGKGSHCTFESSMHTAAVERLELEADLQRALERDELYLDYQPIVDLATRRIASVEALLRWNHPERGMMPPDSFIPLAEESGLILAVGQWVLHRACSAAAKWHDLAPGLTVSVNLSARHFLHASLLDDVTDALDASQLDASRLTLEITENVLMRDSDAVVAKLCNLKRLGVRLALDDFGTGYSSLGYLRRFPIDVLKVDKSFIDGIGRGVEESAVARAIVKLGRTLRIVTVAEGVESADQADHLLAMRCDLAQGYWFSRPLHVDHVTAVLLRGDDHFPLAPDDTSLLEPGRLSEVGTGYASGHGNGTRPRRVAG